MIEQKHPTAGHPSIEKLKQEQGTIPTSADVRELFGGIWSDEENIDDFLSALREWRGHAETGQAA